MELVLFDLETTSAEPATTRAVQAAATAYINGVKTPVLYELCDPGVDISDGAALIHGVSMQMIRDANARRDSDVLLEFYLYLLQPRPHPLIIATHNGTTFDLPILWRIADRPALQLLHIDTMAACARVFPQAPNHKLAGDETTPGLVRWLKLDDGQGAHDARADIDMVKKLIDLLCTDLEMTYLQLAEWMSKPVVLETIHFGKHKGMKWKDVPKGYIWFIANKFDAVSKDVAHTIKHHFNMRCKGAIL